MSYCREEGKDRIIFATKEDHKVPSKVQLPAPDPQPGLILPDGSINWNCPCLGGMATGPCGVQFREAFSCFHYSTAEPKGSDCYDAFKEMQSCMSKYPALYNRDDDKNDDLDLESLSEASQADASDKHPQQEKTSDKRA
ncbi:mitochondrial intermembrane space import and assembly protein 40-B [Schistocerca nitens]|uniref:mitochondrial intermembrane space import and assembly protein 40-B n=1 Tax=Schistocerca nitens TaxID=7011 RepID=UPI002119B2AA|nr:mitochondrial intermembrane space import and assembly protein 40-B [Schistocerca nitens]